MPSSRVAQLWRYLVAPAGADARHAERTAALLRAAGADEELVLAGLLHDRAKPADARLWHRVAATLLEETSSSSAPAARWAERWAPRVRARLAKGDGTFARYLDHAARGAALALAEGRSARVVRLIARHHEPPADEDERRLAEADRLALP
ncbi:MAG: hypothetical protein Q7S25_02620 [Candidatus Limnocylindria bacterium]|nr:hypothetical protein [Candidatus Limnocylindria bacterium]